MKKALLVLILAVITVTGYSQTDTTKPAPVLPANMVEPPDSVLILTGRDLASFVTLLQKSATYEQYTKLTPADTVLELYRWAVRLWNEREAEKKKAKKPK